MTPKPTVQKRAIEPPEGWKPNTGLGYMRCGPGPGDELVSLADVLQWLGEVHNLPTVPALRLLVEGLKPEVFDALFEVQDDDFAKVVPSSFAFGYGTRGSAKNAGQGRNRDPFRFEDDEPKSFWDFEEPVTSQEAEPVEPGLPALLRLIRETGLTRLGSAAVTFEMAHRLWGWGGVATVVPLKSVSGTDASVTTEPSKTQSYDWSDAKTQAALLAAFNAAPGKSQRAKATHLATTEKWGIYSAETLRSRASSFKKSGKGNAKSSGLDVSTIWGNTQHKSKKTG